jgi:hypothetical protein
MENRAVKPVEIILRREGWRMRENDREGESNYYITRTYVNVTVHPPIQQLYVNENFKMQLYCVNMH